MTDDGPNNNSVALLAAAQRQGVLEATMPSPAAMRTELLETVSRDLLGPADGPDEEIHERSVRDRYVVGMLAPKHRVLEPEGDEDLAESGPGTAEDGPTDVGTLQTPTMLPSAFGLTFCVDGNVTALRVTVRWGRYERTRSQRTKNRKTGEAAPVWKRHQIAEAATLPLVRGRLKPWIPNAEQPEVTVRGVARKRDGDTEWTVSLFLVNGQQEPKSLRDMAWLFQPEVVVEGVDGAAVFTRRGSHRTQGVTDPDVYAEVRSLEMLYRKHLQFAVGHSVSVHADVADDTTRALRLATRVIPIHEIARTTPPTTADIPALGGLVLDMKVLAETDDAELPRLLRPLTDAYGQWITQQAERIEDPEVRLADYRETAADALTRGQQSRQRIQEGIDLLAVNTQAAEAFRFLNQAMWYQRIHSLFSERVRQGDMTTMEQIDIPINRTWYPFQLAFILLNLPAMTDLNHSDRSDSQYAIADLLWYPTGGGKSEAYLGLTAYTLGIRRLQGVVEGRSGEHGVAVLMRYTLRLLTLQQFQRATTLICACEKLRRDAIQAGDTRWGTAPFRIGLWVGNKTTPNTTSQSDEAVLLRHEQNRRTGTGDPAQLTNCPWCGKPIEAGKNIKVDKIRGRTLIYCGDPLGRCLFSEPKSPGEGLPVLVVDEEIYRQLPALLIATVDKFAQMPWNGMTQMLFGKVNGFCPRHGFRSPDLEDKDSHVAAGGFPAVKTVPHGPLRPPDLIIQDELHLISGPLGTLVGLYETAVDYLCTWKVNGQAVRPKVIASTATIRNSRLQVLQTFRRRVSVFPPQGLDVEDNFFSRQRLPTEEQPGRLYMGVCAPGKRLKAVLLRVYLAQLAAGQSLYEKYGDRADPWMTLVGYFNSMRELGGMRRLVDDEVRLGLSRIDRRGLPKRKIGETEELTSRRNSADIPVILDRMERSFSPNGRGMRPIDVLLATNMLSVGVDVRRLGLMVVANQPKTTAEYIQATSRVGRTHPGLVCTVMNWARPRDLSHYEQFEHYHDTFYQFVEALSVTPFAERALDRGLSALLIACVRLAAEDYNGNLRAADLDPKSPLVIQAIDAIARRAGEVGSSDTEERVREEMAVRLDAWRARAQKTSGGARLGYSEKKDGQTLGLLQATGPGPWQEFTCLNSLRDVEPMVNLVLDNHGLEDSEPIDTVMAGAAEMDAEGDEDEEVDA